MHCKYTEGESVDADSRWIGKAANVAPQAGTKNYGIKQPFDLSDIILSWFLPTILLYNSTNHDSVRLNW
jgi:hypothetical protein